jgi:hypothetical protein
MNDARWKQMTDFLVGLGTDDVPHTGNNFLAHLIAVYRLMEAKGCSEELCRAGLFHSIYGTQLFQTFTLPTDRRGDVRALIGDRAERLAYYNCAMDRPTFDQALESDREPYSFTDRLTGETVALARADFDDLCRIHLYDWLEQAPRSRHGWGYRRSAYCRMAERVGGIALASYAEVFAGERANAAAANT